MTTDELRQAVETVAQLTFSRSSGPGGQNVNKVNSKATLTIDLDSIPGLGEIERTVIRTRLAHRLGDGSILVLYAQDDRSQLRNRELVIDRLVQLLLRALTPVAKRVPTKPSRASKERRLLSKRHQATKKNNRSLDD